MRFAGRKKAPNVTPLVLIVGLGNPGPQYARTRHNVGFEALQALAARHKVRMEFRNRAQIGVGFMSGTPVALVKPMTFMNLSGQAVAPLAKQYGIPPERILVVADDLDLPVGKVKMKPKGSSGGHNGHKSIIECLRSEDYPRIKVGIGKGGDDAINHVLNRFSPDERALIDSAIARCVEGCESFVTEGLERALTRVNAG